MNTRNFLLRKLRCSLHWTPLTCFQKLFVSRSRQKRGCVCLIQFNDPLFMILFSLLDGLDSIDQARAVNSRRTFGSIIWNCAFSLVNNVALLLFVRLQSVLGTIAVRYYRYLYSILCVRITYPCFRIQKSDLIRHLRSSLAVVSIGLQYHIFLILHDKTPEKPVSNELYLFAYFLNRLKRNKNHDQSIFFDHVLYRPHSRLCDTNADPINENTEHPSIRCHTD